MDAHTDTTASEFVPGTARKLFSLWRAERALVLVRRIVTDAVAAYAHLLQTQGVLERMQRCGPVEQIQSLQGEMSVSVDRLQDYLEELELIGADLRDPARGEVDFPAVLGGRRVELCWRLGEQTIRHWHDPGQDLSRRRLISELVGAEPSLPAAARP